ncbi:MAG TPA: hypothetical protein VLF93_05440 [Candidatus Saccharimonadales bacterium]|nr:hypothetical protein [Candidatus Saccharimonadales bacterium]
MENGRGFYATGAIANLAEQSFDADYRRSAAEKMHHRTPPQDMTAGITYDMPKSSGK